MNRNLKKREIRAKIEDLELDLKFWLMRYLEITRILKLINHEKLPPMEALEIRENVTDKMTEDINAKIAELKEELKELNKEGAK